MRRSKCLKRPWQATLLLLHRRRQHLNIYNEVSSNKVLHQPSQIVSLWLARRLSVMSSQCYQCPRHLTLGHYHYGQHGQPDTG